MMRQVLIAAALVAATGYLWIRYVPSAAESLDRIGVLAILGIAPPADRDAGGGGGFRGGGPVAVVTASVVEARTNDRITALGDGKARQSVTIRSEADGRITAIGAASGSYVKTGSVILQLDDSAERIALERALILEEDARDEAERIERLRTTGSVTVVQTRAAELALRTAELAIAEARYELEQRAIRAPFSGWIGILDADVGDRIRSQDAVGTLTDRSEILIDFRVPERIVGAIEAGQSIAVRPVALPDVELTGRISAIDAVVDPASRTLRVQASVRNDADRLRAGMAFTVELSFTGDALPAVPPLAVQWSGEGPFVWKLADGKAQRVDIAIRQRNSDLVLVDGDLSPGDTVVTEGVQNVRPGAELRPVGDSASRQEAARTSSQRL